MSRGRGTTNTNDRGSSRDRHRRKLWILAHFGDGILARCVGCDRLVDYFSVVCDRIVPGVLGGRYIRSNIRPHCHACSVRTGNELKRVLAVARLAAWTGELGERNRALAELQRYT